MEYTRMYVNNPAKKYCYAAGDLRIAALHTQIDSSQMKEKHLGKSGLEVRKWRDIRIK